MKLQQLSQLKVKPVIEELGNIDKQAGEEMDGKSHEDAINLDDVISGDISQDIPEDENSLEVPADDLQPPAAEENTAVDNTATPDDLRRQGHDGFTLSNVSGQIDGMVKNWFQFAIKMDPEKKEKFLALGERLSEISDLLKSEFE